MARLLAVAALAAACWPQPGCLPELDPSLLEARCRGGAADGFLDEGEGCDDGNREPGDGCASGCTVECAPPGVLRAETGHCYVPIAGAKTVADARFACLSLGPTAGLVTVRTEAERAFAAGVLAGREGVYLTAYQLREAVEVHDPRELGEVGDAKAIELGFREAVATPGILYDEPGLLAEGRLRKLDGEGAGVSYTCPSCLAGPASSSAAGPAWFTRAGDLLGIDATGALVVVPASNGEIDPSATIAGALCELKPPGGPPNPCPSGPTCLRGATAQTTYRGHTYAYFAARSPFDDAEATCASLGPGGHLLLIDDDDERDAVLRRLGLRQLDAGLVWVGLVGASDGFSWVDGEAHLAASSLLLRAPSTSAGRCGALVAQSAEFSHLLGLVAPALCREDQGAAPLALPFVCELR